MSPWLNNLFSQSSDLVIASDVIELSQSGKTTIRVPVNPIVGGDTPNNRIALALRVLINLAPSNSKRHVNVWLSHRIVPHSIVQIDARAMKATDLATTLGAYWEDTLDVSAQVLKVTYQIQPNGQSVFTSCCESSLVSTIETTLRNANWVVKKLSPNIAKTWNDNRQHVGQRNCCMLVAQDKMLSIGVQHGGQWAAWSSEACESTEWSELANRVTRFCRSTGLADPKAMPVWAYAPLAAGTPNSAGLNHWSLLNVVPHMGVRA